MKKCILLSLVLVFTSVYNAYAQKQGYSDDFNSAWITGGR